MQRENFLKKSSKVLKNPVQVNLVMKIITKPDNIYDRKVEGLRIRNITRIK